MGLVTECNCPSALIGIYLISSGSLHRSGSRGWMRTEATSIRIHSCRGTCGLWFPLGEAHPMLMFC